MKRQRGQSMTEYLVALGAGGTLLTAMVVNGDIQRVLDALHDNYRGYSAAISDIQDYGDVAVSAPVSDGGGPVEDNGSSSGGGNDDNSATGELSKLNQIYDQDGNLLGVVQGDKILDPDGNVIGSYIYDATTGEQKAVVNDVEYDNVSVVSVVVGDDGEALAVKAFVVNGEVVGFGYVQNGLYYDALNGKQTSKVPSGAQVVDTRAVTVRDNQGNESAFGYEVNGLVYSLAQVQNPAETYGSAKQPDGELVEMRLTQSSTQTAWSGYSTCVVRSVDWVNQELSGYPGSGSYSFDKTEKDSGGNTVTTTNNAVVESPTNNLGYIATTDQGSAGCGGRWILTEGASDWTLTGPF